MQRIDNEVSTYIHLSKYSRWVESEGRRESWKETVGRLSSFWMEQLEPWDDKEIGDMVKVFEAVEGMEVMPSMRSLMTAGPALTRDNVAGFNCAAIAITHPRVFDEIFYLLMCGCGVGFSVERQYTNRLPEISEEMYDTETVIKVRDSKIGWSKGLKELIAMLYNGDIPAWDLDSIRPAGARLKTFGGRASGPVPLDSLFSYTVNLFNRAKGRKLNSIECHDLVCKIADTVIVGSVRRSACISLSNLTDDRMRRAKMGEWYNQNPERALSNNSVAYTEKPDMISFLKEFRSLYQSKAGERGIVNKVALKEKADECEREHTGDYLLNPCGEAILRDTGGLCNLTEVVIRPTDTLTDLERKVEYATILGTLQSTLSDFRYLRKVWRTNQEEERLLGVSFTGVMDHMVMSGQTPYMTVVEKGDICMTEADLKYMKQWKCGVKRVGDQAIESYRLSLHGVLDYLKEVARETNKKWAEMLGVPPSKQLTLVKPSGTVSQLCGTASGIHPRYSPYYFRRMTQDNKDPLTAVLIDNQVPYVIRGEKTIFSFPIASPKFSVCAREMGAIDQLRLWKLYRDHWCEGNPSQTIYYTDDEFLDVQAWIWKHWDSIGGLSFFPLDDFIYDKEAQPYLEITKDEYDEALASFPEEIQWGLLTEYETVDSTPDHREMACAGDKCEI